MKIKIEIKHWVTGVVLFEFEKENNTIKDTLLKAVESSANLYGANLYGADLRSANLYGADLRSANLYGADLRGADLRSANLYGANLYGADLRSADLYGADLRSANLRSANLRSANLRSADLRSANLRSANLRSADLYKLPKDFIYQCSRDMLFIMQQLKSELPFLKKALLQGKINGSQYNGDCACFVGTLAKGKNDSIENICNVLLFYDKGTHNMGETWFLNIHEGDTPENNQFSAHVLKLVEMVETGNYYTIEYKEPKE